jgi:hypothetical protein
MNIFKRIKNRKQTYEAIEWSMDFYNIVRHKTTGELFYKRFIIPIHTNIFIHGEQFKKDIGQDYEVIGTVLNRFSNHKNLTELTKVTLEKIK